VKRPHLLILTLPAALAASHVLTVFADSGSVLESLARPLVLAVILAIGVQVVLSAVLWGAVRGALAASLVIVAVIDPRLGVVAGGVKAILAYRRWRWSRPVPVVPIAAFGLAVLLIAAFRAGGSDAFQPRDLTGWHPPKGSGAMASAPDIFLILMDGYPRSDTLADWGYDNSWFEAELRTRGFDVSSASRSNYSITALVLSSLMQMRHVDDVEMLTPVPERRIEQERLIRTAINDSPVMHRLAELGYRTVTAGRPADYLTLRAADEEIDGGQLTRFEHQVLYRTWLLGPPLERTIVSQYRGRVLDTLDAIPVTAAEPGPTFMLAHVLSPHTPFTFDRKGLIPDLECAPCDRYATIADESGMTDEAFRAAMIDQIHYLNRLVLDSLEGLLAASPDAVVIVFSDHGTRSDPLDPDEWFATLFAARTPGHEGIYGPAARPIEIFPRLLSAYFGDEIPIAEDRTYYAPEGIRYPLRIVPLSNN
jgi:hypothetical protein